MCSAWANAQRPSGYAMAVPRMELLTAVDRATEGAGSKDGITLLAIRRYRFDNLPSGGLLNIRGRVVGGLRDNVRADLTRLKRESEGAWRPQATR